jgi:aquaglyceroporin related protein
MSCQSITDIFRSSFYPYRLLTDSPMATYAKENVAGNGTYDANLAVRSSERRRTSVVDQPAYAAHGPLIDHKIPQDEAVQAEPDLLWSRIRHTLREPLSEFFGVFILILFGDGVVAQVVLSKGTKGDYQSISWGWG